MNAEDQLDPRVWLLWAMAAGLPPLLGRNPLILLAVLFACLGVRATVNSDGVAAAGWRWIVRLAALFALIGAAFNLLTAHIGDRVIARLPDAIPIVGGILTLNALVYGLLSGLAILILVVIGVTLAASLDHAELLRMLPGRLTTVAVAGSVALVFLPQTIAAFHEIREAQAARGYRLRGARGLIPLLVPLLTGGLERALTLAEALESRGFGGNALTPQPPSPNAGRGGLYPLPALGEGRPQAGVRAIATAVGLATCAVGGYLLAVGQPVAGIPGLAIGLALVFMAGREPAGNQPRRTRYRTRCWTWQDNAVATAVLLALGVEILALVVDPAAFQYQPYPAIEAPHVNLWLLAALGLLLAPAIVAPAPTNEAA